MIHILSHNFRTMCIDNNCKLTVLKLCMIEASASMNWICVLEIKGDFGESQKVKRKFARKEI
jgi:hypothetical protein